MLDRLYINEAKRIRKEYLNNLAFIVKKEGVIKEYVNELNNIKTEIDNTENNSDDFFRLKLIEIDKNIQSVQKYLMVYYDKIKKLDTDQRKLYNNIKDKYPTITDEDMKNEIIGELDSVNDFFIRTNKGLYEEIENYSKKDK